MNIGTSYVICLSILRNAGALFVLIISLQISHAQFSINSTGAPPNSSAVLDISASDKGLLFPHVALTGSTDATTIISPATGLLIYNTANTADMIAGYYFWDGDSWTSFIPGAGISWRLLGNSGLTASTHFIGTSDNNHFTLRTNSIERMRIAAQNIHFLNNGSSIFIGEGAGALDDLSNNKNISIGYRTLYIATIAENTIGIGFSALNDFNPPGPTNLGPNIGIGYNAQTNTTTGINNVSLGYSNMSALTTGSRNTSIGGFAFWSVTTGSGNCVLGPSRGGAAGSASYNCVLGYNALSGTTGNDHISIGYQSMNKISGGSNNIAIGGLNCLFDLTTSSNNIAIGGLETGKSITSSTGRNLLIGSSAGYAITGSSNICLGYSAGSSETGSDKLYIDNSSATSPLLFGNFATDRVGINCNAPAATLHVEGDIRASILISTAALACSDIRYKKNIAELKNSLQKIMQLRGVTYFWKQNEFPQWGFTGSRQIGFIAQEVEIVFPELVKTDENGFKSVDYIKLYPVLTEAIKGQQVLLSACPAQIKRLQERIDFNLSGLQKCEAELKELENKLLDAKLQR